MADTRALSEKLEEDGLSRGGKAIVGGRGAYAGLTVHKSEMSEQENVVVDYAAVEKLSPQTPRIVEDKSDHTMRNGVEVESEKRLRYLVCRNTVRVSWISFAQRTIRIRKGLAA